MIWRGGLKRKGKMDSSVNENSGEMDQLKDMAVKDGGELLNVQFSHEELMKLTREAIDNIIQSDPLLNGLPRDATVEEIKAQTAVAQGQAITLYLHRGQLPKLSIVVSPDNTTVLDLKKAIQRQTNLALVREKVQKKISWRHVWKKYHLWCNEVLRNEKESIKSYGIGNRAVLNYVKKRREKNRITRMI